MIPNSVRSTSAFVLSSVKVFHLLYSILKELFKCVFEIQDTHGWKYVEASNSSSPFDFTIDYSLIYGGAVGSADIIQYFVVAQDQAGTPNVGIQSGSFNATPSSVVLGSSAFPISGSIDQYTILGTLSGNITVGSGKYLTLTGAGGLFETINTSLITGNITVTIVGNLTEDGTNALNQFNEEPSGSNFTMSINPDGTTAREISGSYAGGLIRFNGADRITIDGRYSGSGNYLKFLNSSTSGQTFVFQNDATGNTIRYCDIQGVNASTTSGTIVFGTTTGTSGNDNNTIEYCNIYDGASTPYNAIYASGTTTSSAHNNSGISISNCNIYNFFYAAGADNGIIVSSGNTDWTINANSLYQTSSRTYSANANHIGINISNSSGNNFAITNNYIGGSSANCGGSPWTIEGTYTNRFRGISLSVGSSTPSSVQGNTIANFNHTTNSSATTAGGGWVGIYLTAGSANIGNSSGNTIGAATGNGSITLSLVSNPGGVSSGIYVDAASTTTNISNNVIGSVTIPTSTIAYGFSGIVATAGTSLTIHNNVIGSTSTSASINVNTGAASTSAQLVKGIHNTSSASIAITNNTVANIVNNYLPSSANSANVLGGIFSSAGTNTITGNTVRDMTTAAYANGSGATASLIGVSMTSSTAGSTVSQNTIMKLSNTNATQAVAVIGVYYAGASSGTNAIARNLIHSLNLFSGSDAASITGIYQNGGIGTIANNMIRLGIDEGGNSITSSVIISGILKNSATNFNVYHNTVYISGDQVSTGAANTYAFRRAATGTDEVINNIFVNKRSNDVSTGKHYAIGINAKNTLTSNYNVLLANGTGGKIGLSNTTECDALTDWQTETTTDANSLGDDPVLISPESDATALDLHINTTDPTPVEGAGVYLAAITEDFDGNTRSGLSPTDIGADAGDFIANDISAPAISYTPLGNIATTANRQLTNVVITDASGVETNAGSAPRIYYKRSTDNNEMNDNSNTTDGWKYTETTSSSSPFTFTIDHSLLNGGSANLGDVIQYFVVAQDLAPSANIAINSGTFSSAPNSVGLNPDQFPILGTIREYTITGMAGTYTVGTGGNYTTLTGAGGLFADLNTRSVVGNIVVEIISDITTGETGANALNQWTEEGGSNFTLTMRPDAATLRTISGSYAGGLIRLNGADRVTIDGRFSGSGKYLAFTNTSTSGSAVIQVISSGTGAGANSNTIQNCILTGGSNTSITYGVHVGASSLGTAADDNDNLSIIGNEISKVHYGIFAKANATGVNNNLTITGNVIGSEIVASYIGRYGIEVSQASGANISNNVVFNIVYTSGNPFAIICSTGVVNTTLAANKIYNVTYTGTAGYGGKGIDINSGNSAANLTLKNNVIFGVSGDGYTTGHADAIYGIRIQNNQGGINLYYNSVNMYGSISRSSATADQCYALYVGTGVTTLNVMNNVFVNSIENTTGVSKSYAIYSASANTAFADLNYNDYYATGNEGVLGYLASDKTSLTTWQAATTKDAYSISADPGFTSNTNLLPDVNSSNSFNVNGMGYPVAGVTDDYNGTARSTTLAGGATDLGAYEFTPIADPNSIAQTGTIASGNTTTYALNGRTFASISWLGTNFPSIDVKYFSGVTPSDAPAGSKYGNVFWRITATGGVPNDWSYRLVLHYDPATMGTIPDEGSIRLAKRSGSSGAWTIIHGTLNSTDKTITTEYLYSFSEFAMSDDESPLPVELIRLDANCTGNKVVVGWTTLTETNCDFYDVMHSTDAREFKRIASAKGHGTISSMNNYAVNVNVDTKQSNYFRLLQHDYNGEAHWSHIIYLACAPQHPSQPFISNWINNSEGLLLGFYSNVSGDYTIKVMDVQGRMVYSGSGLASEGENTINAGIQLASSVYMVQLIIDGKVYNQKILVR